MGLELLDLPDEVVSKIFRYLPATELVKVGSACRQLHEIQQNDDHIWKWYCWRDYKVNEQYLWQGWTFRDFYTKALFKYHFLFGWWKRKVKHYGGLFLVKEGVSRTCCVRIFSCTIAVAFTSVTLLFNFYVEKDSFVGYECLPPLDDFIVADLKWVGFVVVPEDSDYSRGAFNRLRFNRVFAIEPVGKEAGVVCYQPCPGGVNLAADGLWTDAIDSSHLCDAQCSERQRTVIERADDGFSFVCHRSDKHDSNYSWFRLLHFLRLHHGIVIKRPECADDVVEEFEDHGYDLRDRFMAFDNAASNCQFEPLQLQCQLPKSVKRSCIKPGFYCSLYSVHGWEILNFRYNDDGQQLEGVKVKGDPNVPAGKVSVRVFLTKPVHLTADDQASSADIARAVEHAQAGLSDQANEQETGDGLQPFRIPQDCEVNHRMEHPKFCRWTYLCECQVAETGYVDPKFVRALFFGFDDDTFAVLWLDFRTFFHYFRATNVDCI